MKLISLPTEDIIAILCVAISITLNASTTPISCNYANLIHVSTHEDSEIVKQCCRKLVSVQIVPIYIAHTL